MDKKKCYKCKTEKNLVDFYVSAASRDGVGSYCKLCDSMARKERRLKNLEREKACKKEYWKRERGRFLVKMKEYYENTKDRDREKRREHGIRNRESFTVYHRKWRAETGRGKIHWHTRRQREKNASGNGVSVEQWAQLCTKYGNKCLCCGRIDIKLTLDHVIPLSKNGVHDISNIQPLCFHCNSVKGIKTIDYRLALE